MKKKPIKPQVPKNPAVYPAGNWLFSPTGVILCLRTKTQKAFAAAQVEEIEAVDAKQRQGSRTDIVANLPQSSSGKAREKAAARFEVSPRYVQDAKAIRERAPDLEAQCAREELNICEAIDILKRREAPITPKPESKIDEIPVSVSIPAVSASRPTYETDVIADDFTTKASEAFDYTFTGHSVFVGWPTPDLSKFSEFKLGMILGPSGSGKSLLLRNFGQEKSLAWDPRKAVVSHFGSPDEALDKLMAVGLNSTPAWCRPFHVLSGGEQFRASLARKLESGAVIDEFTSVVDRNVAKAASVALRRYVDKHPIAGLVVATCHLDVLNWLRPDWYFDTTDGTLHDGRLLRRPAINLRVYSCKRTAWEMFKDHHYLTAKLPASARTFLATIDFGSGETVVGFASAMAMGFQLKDAWREARTVILPDFQGLGIGPRLSDAVAQLFKNEGKRYFSKTAHPRFGQYRENHPELWKPTSKNLVRRTKDKIAKQKRLNTGITAAGTEAGETRTDMHNQGLSRFDKLCFSHEYIGAKE